MSEFLGEPDQGLKQELRDLIDSNLPEGQNVVYFPLEEGGNISISGLEISDLREGPYHSVTITERFSTPDGVRDSSHSYCLFLDGNLEKMHEEDDIVSDEVKEQLPFSPGQQARIDQRIALEREQLVGFDSENKQEQADSLKEFYYHNLDILDVGFRRAVAETERLEEADDTERALGIRDIGAVELQEVIDKIRAAIPNSQPR